MINLWIKSSHASLEWDEARMFLDMGYKVTGQWDIGSKQRPKIMGITDVNTPLTNQDIVILHQIPDYCAEMKRLLDAGHKVVLVAFGQSGPWQHEAMAKMCRDYPNAYIAAYAQREYDNIIKYKCSKDKCRLIRFGKYFADYKPWVGSWGVVFGCCNSWPLRGEGCGWRLMEQIKKCIPCLISGKETTTVDGLGEIEPEALLNIYRQAACFVSLGTAPAPIVLSLIDSFCAGTPTVILDNSFGIAAEPLPGIIIEVTVHGVVDQLQQLLTDRQYRYQKHLASLEARKLFDVQIVKKQWAELLEEVNG